MLKYLLHACRNSLIDHGISWQFKLNMQSLKEDKLEIYTLVVPILFGSRSNYPCKVPMNKTLIGPSGYVKRDALVVGSTQDSHHSLA